MNRIIKFAIGILVARAVVRGERWLMKASSPLARGAGAMAKKSAPDPL